MTALTTQLQAEMNVVRRNGEQLLVTLGIPLLLLGFFSLVDVLPTNEKDPVNFLVPGILALAVMSTSMVSLGIATGFERNYLVLKRLAATPLGTTRLIAAKTLSIATVEAVQMILLISLGFLLGWSPQQANWLLALCAVILGTSTRDRSVNVVLAKFILRSSPFFWYFLEMFWGILYEIHTDTSVNGFFGIFRSFYIPVTVW